MDKAGLFDHIAEVGRNSQPGLEGAPMTRVLVIAEFLLPEHGPGGRPQKALLRMSSEADGNPVIRWVWTGPGLYLARRVATAVLGHGFSA